MSNETWKDIHGYEGFYQVSNLGNVKSLERTVPHKKTGTQFCPERILKITNSNGYSCVKFSLKGKVRLFGVHRLVANAFINNPENKPQVNHINGIKTDNRVENLEWNTCSENNQHAVDIGLKISVKGSKVGTSKLKEKDVINIKKRLTQKESCNKIAKDYGVTHTTISRIKRNLNWKHVK